MAWFLPNDPEGKATLASWYVAGFAMVGLGMFAQDWRIGTLSAIAAILSFTNAIMLRSYLHSLESLESATKRNTQLLEQILSRDRARRD